MKINSLRRYERLKSTKWIEKLFSKEAFSVYEDYISIRFITTDISDYPLKAGFSVSKRLYRDAHDRNQYKRWLRECYRVRKTPLVHQLIEKRMNLVIFIILTRKLEGKSFQEVEAVIEKLMSRLSHKISKIESQNI